MVEGAAPRADNQWREREREREILIIAIITPNSL